MSEPHSAPVHRLRLCVLCARRRKTEEEERARQRDEETSLAKLFLWRGTSRWAMMLRDDLAALEYLAARPEVDYRRIGAMGMSMGSTRTWWLAALDERIAAAVCVACLTRYQALVRRRALARHGHVYTPGIWARTVAWFERHLSVAPGGSAYVKRRRT